MINTVESGSHHLYHTSSGGFLPSISPDPNNPMQGLLRLNGQQLEVFDGNDWFMISLDNTIIGMSPTAEDAIDWAEERMEEEREWKELAEKNSTVKIALDNVEKAKKQLRVTANLARNHETTS